jgi:perosamine synthetase
MTKREKFHHPILGYNYKLSDIHAAIGLVQLRKLDNYIERKRANIKYLRSRLNQSNLKLPVELDYAFNVYYVCHILAEKGKDKILRRLRREGIEARPLLSFIPEQPPYQKYRYDLNELHVARNAHRRGFYISNSPLLTENELDLITSALAKSVSDIQK